MRAVCSTSGCFVLVAMLLATILPQGGWVLCIESDGHVVLEAANVSGQCTDAETTAPLQHVVIASAESHCGDCLDQTIETDDTRRVVSEAAPVLIYWTETEAPLLPVSYRVRRSTEVCRPPTQSVHLMNAVFLI